MAEWTDRSLRGAKTTIPGLDPGLMATARAEQRFDDVLVGPQKDGRLPATHSGVRVSSLPASARNDVTQLITADVGDVPSAISKPLIARYDKQYSRTRIS